MITIKDVKKAMKMINNPNGYLHCRTLHKQLAQSLDLYAYRNEYDGTFDSAVDCLELAGYEVENAVIALPSDENESDTEV